MRFLIVFLTAFLLFASPVSQAAAAGVDVPASMSEATLKQWTAKQGQYRRALNNVRSVSSSMDRYLRWAKDGPSEKARSIGGISDMSSSLDRIAKAFEDNGKIAAKIPALDEPFAAMTAAAMELSAVSKEASSYYQRKDYMADAMAKGKEMHPKIMDAYGKFSKAAAELTALEEDLSDKLEPQELAGIEKQYGKEYMWHHMAAMAKARHIVKLLPEDVKTKVDGKAFSTAVEAFAASVKEFDAYYESKGKEAIGKMARMPLSPSSFDSFLAATRELGQDFTTPPKSRNALASHMNSAVRAYNTLINNSNRTQFLVRR